MEELSYVGKTISDFLSTLATGTATDANSERIFDNLYSDGATVRVILREALPPVAQQFVMRLAFGGARPFQEAIFRKWCRTAPSSSLQILQRLQILRPVSSPQTQGKSADRQVLMLHQNFQTSLVKYLTCPDCSESNRPDRPQESPSETELMHHAVASWDAFLEELTRSDSPGGNEGSEGSEGQGEADKADKANKDRSSSTNSTSLSSSKAVAVMALAKVLGLHGSGPGTSNASKTLTSKGFQFILDERQQQLWSLILTFLKVKMVKIVKSGHDRADRADRADLDQVLGPLKMIFAIGELKLGQRLIASDQAFVQVLTELGILYGTTGGFHVTPAGLALFNKDCSITLSRITGSSDEDQGIIVESNFKVYCYTSNKNDVANSRSGSNSSLHVKLLSYFCEIFMELPKLVVAQLTADSVLKALKRGIRVANIVRYLEAAAHPLCTLPSNVKGQLEVWESSRSRASTSSAVLFEWQPGDADDIFLEAEKLARDAGSLLWSRRRAFDLPPLLVVQANSSTVQQIRALTKSNSAKTSTSRGNAFAFRLKPEGKSLMDLD